MDTTGDLTDLVYEAAIVPDLWSDVLARVANLAGAASGALLVFSRPADPPRYKTTPLTETVLQQHVETGDWKRGRTAEVPRMHGRGFIGFAQTDDVMGTGPQVQDTVSSALASLGLGVQVGSLIHMPSGERALFTFERWKQDGRYSDDEIDALNALRPHLGRSSLMAARLGLERARDAVALMDGLGLPAVVLSSAGRLLTANALFEPFATAFILTARNELRLRSSEADVLLRRSLNDAAASVAAIRSIAVPPSGDRSAMVLHTLPLRRSAQDLFNGGDLLVVATEVRLGGEGLPVNILRALFDLTPAEARIAASLAAGQTLEAASAESGIMASTGRSHLKRVFDKTGTHQQSQLVALLHNTRSPFAS